ncbi:hypothetical protein PX52LOC_07986 [Limnoglobus roseus]|uniref:Uncharacterized protein n=1 Tax=Limnoglobus roseus TaxID=2598579 RepID=A0A5C1AQH3_9BACT|nr:hypothetical protein PX52LOC_07986 [Limnoglobus roseus]
MIVRVSARRFFCPNPGCERAIFCERLPGFASPHARLTTRLAAWHRAIGETAGGEAGPRSAPVGRSVPHAGQRRHHPPTGGRWNGRTRTGVPVGRDRRLRPPQGACVRHHPDRPGAVPCRRSVRRPGWRGCQGVVTGAPGHRSRHPRPRVGVREGGRGRGPVAPAEEPAGGCRAAVRAVRGGRPGGPDAGPAATVPTPSPDPVGSGVPIAPPPAAADAPGRPPRVENHRRAHELHGQGHSHRQIARHLRLSRAVARRYLRTAQYTDGRAGRVHPTRPDGFAAYVVNRRLAAAGLRRVRANAAPPSPPARRRGGRCRTSSSAGRAVGWRARPVGPATTAGGPPSTWPRSSSRWPVGHPLSR